MGEHKDTIIIYILHVYTEQGKVNVLKMNVFLSNPETLQRNNKVTDYSIDKRTPSIILLAIILPQNNKGQYCYTLLH